MDDLYRQDAADLADDAKRLLLELGDPAVGAAMTSGECRPPLDVVEAADAVVVVVDVPDVPARALRVTVRRNTVLIVGAKVPAEPVPGARFHLAERAYGRFARAVRLTGTIDVRRAKALVTAGQLRLSLPRIADRRGQAIDIPVERG